MGPVKGGVYTGENTNDAALREVKEETGLNVRDAQMLDTVKDKLEQNGNILNIRGHIYTCVVDGVRPTPELKEEDGELEHDVYQWVTLEEATKMELYPPVANTLLKNLL